jgi:hypothetical protein
MGLALTKMVGLGLAIISSKGPYFENAPTLGLYPTQKIPYNQKGKWKPILGHDELLQGKRIHKKTMYVPSWLCM